MRDEAIGAHPALLRAWLDATPDGVIAVDASGRVLIHNRPASRVTGLTPPDAEGRPWREVLQLDGAVADALWAPSVANRSAEVVTEVLCAQGNRRTAELTSSPWREPGHGSGVLILIRDLAVLCRQRTAPAGRAGYGNLVGAHPAMQALYDMIELVAPSDAPVVIEGETGVGKELVAQLLHARSRRAERPLIAINCAALALGVLESELFGHVRGAFTGAVGSVTGRFALADTGTIFLDEISEAPVSTQVKLLRVLQSGEFERVGDPRPRRTDVRVIAASNRPLEDEVAARRFREDLYYRLKVVGITVPPLRERCTDIASLAEH
ncbi:MAG TPA: sigma 54-interacting transcriptional regulator, partial [Acidimicrobiales bacterium]